MNINIKIFEKNKSEFYHNNLKKGREGAKEKDGF